MMFSKFVCFQIQLDVRTYRHVISWFQSLFASSKFNLYRYSLDVAMFVDHEDEVYEPGSNQTVQMCDFEFPYKCEKETPYFVGLYELNPVDRRSLKAPPGFVTRPVIEVPCINTIKK
jgi:hypothetical protein